MRGSSVRWAAAAAAVLVTARGASAVSIDLGTAMGAPGETVTIGASLSTEVGETVIATQNRIDFPRDVHIAANPGGTPDCTGNPAIDKEATGFRFLPLGCDPATACTAVRVFVLSFQNLDPIPDGPLYSCRVAIAADAVDGIYPLTGAERAGSAPGGVLLPADGVDGSVTVVREPVARIVVGETSGDVGELASVDVSLELLDDPPAAVAGVQVDLGFDPAAPVADDAGEPSCTVDPAIDKEATHFTFLPTGCTPDDDCTGVRAVVRSALNVDPIDDGAVLFTCTLDLLAAGTYPLTAANPSASAALGGSLLAIATDGEVVVSEPPPPPPCTGDCDGSRDVAINELLLGVNIVIGSASLDQCPALDTENTGEVTISQLIQAVNAALGGCPS